MFLKTLILAKLLVCPSQTDHKWADTLVLNEKDYRVIHFDDRSMEIEISDSIKGWKVGSSANAVIIVKYKSDRLVAKGNPMLKSSVPENCDMFYLMLDNGLAFFRGRRISFIRIIATPNSEKIKKE